MTLPFTYLITETNSGKRYYGTKYSEGCHPSMLGTTYFSSSATMRELINSHGIAKFKFDVRRTFKTPADAIRWETKVLTRLNAQCSPNWYNKNNGGAYHNLPGELSHWYGRKHSEETRQKMSNIQRTRPRNPHSAATKEKLHQSALRRLPKSPETRIKQSVANKGKIWINDGKSLSKMVYKTESMMVGWRAGRGNFHVTNFQRQRAAEITRARNITDEQRQKVATAHRVKRVTSL
jgi:hypothetical protein